MQPSPFTPELFSFLADLKEHNDREWFARNKVRYEEHAREPALDFVEAFAPRLHEISPHFMAGPRSIFRIYRDTRFSKDKTPYKTQVGIHFRHEVSKDVHAPGFYLHLEPGACFGGMGIWHPDTPTANRIRQAIAADGDRWAAATGGLQLMGEKLKRPPRGFDRDHPLIEDIKRKNFGASVPLEQRTVTAPGFVDEYARLCREGAGLIGFLCDALGLAY
jgi:uncharacterized protein (TIGR02453 family)